MTITPEMVAKLVFATTQLRYFEKEFRLEPNIEMQDIVLKWQCKVDELLNRMGMQEYMPYDQLTQLLKIVQ